MDTCVRLPWESRVLLWVAGRLAPPGERPEFLARWSSELGHHTLLLAERGVRGEFARPRLRSHAAGAVRVAWTLRSGDSGPVASMVRTIRTGWFAMATAILIFVAGLGASGGLRAWRVSRQPLAIPEQERLVTLEPKQSPFSSRLLLTPRQLFRIRRDTAGFLQPVEGFSARWTRSDLQGATGSWRCVGVTTKEFFPLLGLTYLPGAVLGAEFARKNPELLGRRITIWDQSYLVTGILPDDLRLSAPRPDVWITWSDSTFRKTRHPMVAVAKLAPGLTLAQAAARFERIAPDHRPLFEQHLEPLRHGQRALLAPVAWVLGLLAAVVLITGIVRARQHGHYRYEASFAARTILVLAGAAALLTEVLSRQGNFYGIFFVVWGASITAGVLLYAAWRDHSVRCRHCLSRMTKPVRMGSHASPLLEGLGAEWLCENGHGALWLEGADAQAFGPTKWRAA